MNMTLQSSIKDRIPAAQKEVPLKGEVRTLIMDDAHKSKYFVHPGADKMYYDLRDMYWWPGIKKDIAEYVRSWDVHLLLVEFSYNNSYHSSVRCAPFEALYGRKCHSPIMWADVGEGDYVLLKGSPWKGVVRFGKKGKLAPRFVRPFKIIEKVGPVAYRLDLLEELNGVHDTFHVSNLKKCLADPTLQLPLDEI
ncbi:putative reverse transcriptase domain-containing protein [Tanacetum coccineum]